MSHMFRSEAALAHDSARSSTGLMAPDPAAGAEELADTVAPESLRLADLVFSPYVAVRHRAVEHPAATLEALAILADDRDPTVRRLAEQRLGRLQSAHRRAG